MAKVVELKEKVANSAVKAKAEKAAFAVTKESLTISGAKRLLVDYAGLPEVLDFFREAYSHIEKDDAKAVKQIKKIVDAIRPIDLIQRIGFVGDENSPTAAQTVTIDVTDNGEIKKQTFIVEKKVFTAYDVLNALSTLATNRLGDAIEKTLDEISNLKEAVKTARKEAAKRRKAEKLADEKGDDEKETVNGKEVRLVDSFDARTAIERAVNENTAEKLTDFIGGAFKLNSLKDCDALDELIKSLTELSGKRRKMIELKNQAKKAKKATV
jgi:hypothetical protein